MNEMVAGLLIWLAVSLILGLAVGRLIHFGEAEEPEPVASRLDDAALVEAIRDLTQTIESIRPLTVIKGRGE